MHDKGLGVGAWCYRAIVGSSTVRPFAPLDPDERRPRQEILDEDRGGLQLQRQPAGWRKLSRAELVATIAAPALILLGIALGESGAPAPVTVISIALLILALVAFALSGR
jgi:hypothetical protein